MKKVHVWPLPSVVALLYCEVEKRFFMPIVPQSEIQVNFSEEIFKETHEKRGEILAKFSVDFRPSISREIGHKKFHTNSSTHQDLKFHTAEPKFFHNVTLGVGGPKVLDVASDDPPDEALSCRRRDWDVPYLKGFQKGAFLNVKWGVLQGACLLSGI